MSSQIFFKLFPPPHFLDIPYAGLDISDDAVRCIEYSESAHGLIIKRFGTKPLAIGTIEGGEIKNSQILSETISSLAKEMKIHVVKASLPEEKMYLFKTEVQTKDEKKIRQNIEFKLEENVPISPAESIFFFDIIPGEVGNNNRKVSVSVAPRSLVNPYLEAIKSAGLSVLSFEVQAKAIARALVPENSTETSIIVYIMDRKTGIYVVCGGVVCFTSTVPWGNKIENSALELRKHLSQVMTYWVEHGQETAISKIILSGHGALADGLVSQCSPDANIKVEIGKVWQNAFSQDVYIPPIIFEDSLGYAIAAGLALPSH
jgi:Tfp pilus assembly PilM family ATPase